MKIKGWRKLGTMLVSLVVCWHVAITGINHKVDLVALAALIAALFAGPMAYMGSNVWKEHIRLKNGGNP